MLKFYRIFVNFITCTSNGLQVELNSLDTSAAPGDKLEKLVNMCIQIKKHIDVHFKHSFSKCSWKGVIFKNYFSDCYSKTILVRVI